MCKNISLSDCECVMVVTILLRSELKSLTNAIEYLLCFFTPITDVLLQSPSSRCEEIQKNCSDFNFVSRLKR